MEWFRFYDDALDEPKVQQLPPALFKKRLRAAKDGEVNEFSPFLEGPFQDRGRLPAHEWAAIRRTVFERDDFTCRYCGERGKRLECDHVVPVARGGDHGLDNLATACFGCNRSKHAKTVEEWLG